MIIVSEMTKTCGACPAQWEGTTSDGKRIYVRYRHGYLSIGIGATIDEAIDNETFEKEVGDQYDGWMDEAELAEHTRGMIEWPTPEDADGR